MAVATTIPRYNKTQKIFVNNEEITLIEHLKRLRTEKNITKKKISNIIKQNDYWYSQIERDGKHGDDNRQKTIYKPDLIDILSIVKFGANSFSELDNFRNQSELYLEKELHALPLSESQRTLEWYQINNIRTESEQNSLFSSLIDSIVKSLQQGYYFLSREGKDNYLNALKEMNASLKIDPLFIVFLAGLPLSEFLYESEQSQILSLLKQLALKVDDFSKMEMTERLNMKNTDYLNDLRTILEECISDSAYLRRQTFELLPDDKITF